MTLRFARPILALVAVVAAGLVLSRPAVTREARAEKPLKALLVTGGCCHDYDKQAKILPEGVTKRANVEWTIVHEGGNSTNHKVSIYSKPDWADAYDVVVHNECFADVTDMALIKNVIDAHKNGKPAVVVHCAMHTFMKLKTDEYREFLGVSTNHHGRRQPLDVKVLVAGDAIMTGFPSDWVAKNEELYAIDKVWPDTEVLAKAYSVDDKKDHGIIWKHTYGKGRVFGTTMAHTNEVMSDPVYLNMFTNGLLWSVGKLDAQGKPAAGYGPVEKTE